jgi:putative transposase
MPWREICPMDEKLRFVAAVLAAEQSMTELCASFGISRKTGYKWLGRYVRRGPQVCTICHGRRIGCRGRSRRNRRPRSSACAMRIRAGGPRMRAKLLQGAAEQAWLAASTIGELLRRQGLSQRRKRRRHAVPNPGPLTVAASANDVWCIDFKGWFRTADHARCDPLTVSDAFSRYLLCAQGLAQPDHARCRAQLERVFREYGLPRVIRSDNGPPFASTGVGGLTRLGVWWIKRAITPERIAPGKPEQNGRHERMHKTLKAETATPPATNLAQHQQRFHRFRHEFNHERPHEALGQTAPAHHHAPSPRRYPARLQSPVYPPDYQVRRVRHNGEIKWAGELIFLSTPLIGELVGVKETDTGDAELYFGPVPLATIDRFTFKLKRSSPGWRGGQPPRAPPQPSPK